METPKFYVSEVWKDIEYIYFNEAGYMSRKKLTKQEFEQIINDKFEAVLLNENREIQYIWTTKYICKIKYIKNDFDVFIEKYLRNWKGN